MLAVFTRHQCQKRKKVHIMTTDTLPVERTVSKNIDDVIDEEVTMKRWRGVHWVFVNKVKHVLAVC